MGAGVPEIQPDDALKYSLDACNQQVEYTSHLCEGQPIGLTAEGSPNSGLLDAPPGFELTNPSGEFNEEDIDEFTNKCVAVPQSMALGVQVPLFLDAPDAAAYHFRVENGYTFGVLVIDQAAADTVLIDPIFDLFLAGDERVDRGQPFASSDFAERHCGIRSVQPGNCQTRSPTGPLTE